MAEALVAPSSPSRGKKRVVRRRTGPTIRQLITQTVAASNERSGVSLAALKKALAALGYDVQKNRARIKLAVKGLVSRGVLVRTKGGSGSLMMGRRLAAKGRRRRRRRRVGRRATRKTKKPAKRRARRARGARRARATRKSPKRARRARTRKVRRTRKKTVRKTKAKRAPARKAGRRRVRRRRSAAKRK